MEKRLHPGMLISRKCNADDYVRRRGYDFLIVLCVNHHDVLFFDGARGGQLLYVDVQNLKRWLDDDEWTVVG